MSPQSCCILLFTLQRACYTCSVCLSPAKRLFIIVNVVFVVFPPQQAHRERARRREVFPIVWRIFFSRRRGRVARGKPQGLVLLPYAGRVAGSATGCRRGCKSRSYKQTFCCSLGREACRPARGLIAQGAAALVSAATLVSAARGGRLEGGREREVGGQLHRARVLRAASLHLSKAKPVFGVARTVCVLPSSKVPPPETLPWLSLAERTVSVRFLA